MHGSSYAEKNLRGKLDFIRVYSVFVGLNTLVIQGFSDES